MAAVPQSLFAPDQQEATILAHETVNDDKRFTVYKVEIQSTKGSKFVVYRRYSEFRELYENLCKFFPAEKDKFKFPPKKLIGNFNTDFLQARQKGLIDFIQHVLSSPRLASHECVKAFVQITGAATSGGASGGASGRGRGHARKLSDEVIEVDSSLADGRPGIPFDLGDKEDKKTSVEDFQMLKVIGKGSFGKVLLGKHVASSVVYAIKVLSKEAIVKQNEVKHIMSERNVLMGNVSHPFLVGLHYSFQTPAKLYFVLDYVNGGELFFHLQREKRFIPLRARFYAAEITSGLGFMHALNIVYRDLKPENILLDNKGHVRLTDFGLCKMNVAPGGTTATFCGTPEFVWGDVYLAPEVLKKQPYGRAVDWWCLGCVTYEMMCGLPPFYNRDTHTMYERILNDPLSFPDFVPAPAQAWLSGLLTRLPAQRLGGSLRDSEDVKAHPFFGGLDWAALERREMVPPFNPDVMGDMDLKNIDPEFVNEPLTGSLVGGGQHPMLSVVVSDAFDGFSFMGHVGTLGESH